VPESVPRRLDSWACRQEESGLKVLEELLPQQTSEAAREDLKKALRWPS